MKEEGVDASVGRGDGNVPGGEGGGEGGGGGGGLEEEKTIERLQLEQ